MTPTNAGCKLIHSRPVAFLDAETLSTRMGREALFRTGDMFVLYLSNDQSAFCGEERVIKLTLREALIWLDESVDEAGSFWH